MSAQHMDVYEPPSAIEGKDYNVQIKIRNGPLMRAIRMRGYKSVITFARAHKLDLTSTYKYLGLRQPPFKYGRWTTTALRLARALRLPPDSLFPEQHLEQALAKNTGEFEVSREELCLMFEQQAVHTPEELMLEDQTRTALLAAMQTLPERMERILRLRFGFDCEPHTLEEVAQKFNVSRERIRDIEAKALRQLRDGDRLKKLATAHEPAQVKLDIKLDEIRRRNEFEKQRWREALERKKQDRENALKTEKRYRERVEQLFAEEPQPQQRTHDQQRAYDAEYLNASRQRQKAREAGFAPYGVGKVNVSFQCPPEKWWTLCPQPGRCIQWGNQFFMRESDLGMLTDDQREFLREVEGRNGIVRLVRD